ncbi:MAG TPA: hypothetical protein VLA97_05105 [Nocardioidaceae bacterium]|nr:hypothetical protein [Nocardioidaceae bacterium]
MRLLRYVSLLVSVSLLGLPAVAAAPANAAESYTTRVVMKIAQARALYNTSVGIAGQAVYTDTDGQTYAVPGGTAVLERQFAGTRTWKRIATDDYTSSFYFTVTARQNATYRVRYLGTTDGLGNAYSASANSRILKVARDLNDRGVKRSGKLLLKGRVAPAYARQVVYVDRKTCERCAWRSYSRVRTTSRSTFSARVQAPRSGAWYYRARITSSKKFITSYSDTYRAYTY